MVTESANLAGLLRVSPIEIARSEAMTKPQACRQSKKPYSTPRVVDFGTIVDMTDGCLGMCVDGESGGMTWVVP